jgi:isoleucyl-tRNA synthetase
MPPFQPVPAKPDHVALEHATLERWERERTFETLRDRNRGNERFSFIDGPITANNPMGVHHGWGRTLKDVWQRYAAMRGLDLRYQNGFDCQGLWVEVGVEKELGLNSKREIEAYGLDRFARACRDRVAHFSKDDRPEHLLHLGLSQAVQRPGLALQGPPVDAVVPALRDIALPARADRLLQGSDPPVAPRAHAARRP